MGTTFNLWLLSKPGVAEITSDPWTSLSQVLSLLGTTMLAITFWLSTRAKFWEDIFGGLDKVNRIHHILGGLSLVFLVHHPLLLVINALPNWQVAARYVWLSGNTSYNWGVLALYSMILVLMATFLINLPYELWLKSHDFIGISLILASVHIFLISSDVSRFWPLRVWIFILLGTAVYAYIYKVFLYKWLGPKYKYQVKEVKVDGDLIWIKLTAVGEKMNYRPGQFAFVKFIKPGLGDFHPFSMMSVPEEAELEFGVKAVGDYTLKLKGLAEGTEAIVMGPNGRFGEKFLDKKEAVLIAGGIGATPIVSMIRQNNAHDKNISVFYCSRKQECSYFQEIFNELSKDRPNMVYFEYIDREHLTAGEIEKQTGSLENKRFFICGPEKMMKDLAGQLHKYGVKKKDIIYENFNFK